MRTYWKGWGGIKYLAKKRSSNSLKPKFHIIGLGLWMLMSFDVSHVCVRVVGGGECLSIWAILRKWMTENTCSVGTAAI